MEGIGSIVAGDHVERVAVLDGHPFEPLAKLLFLPEDTELAIRTSAGRMLLVNTAQIAAKTTRDSQGVAVVTLKKNQTIASVVPAETLELANPHRYRVRSLPATGALIRAEDEGEQMSLL